MELSKQVVSLDLAQKLKELGVKQESLFRWDISSGVEDRLALLPEFANETQELISAFTVAELGEMLKKYDLNYWYSYPDFRLQRATESTSDARDEKEADARAKMLIHLLENKLI